MDKFTYSMLIIYSPGVFDISNGEVFIKVNDCPTTVTDTYVVDEGGILIVDSLNGLLNNDSDINGDKLFAYKDSTLKFYKITQKVKKFSYCQ